MEVSFQLRRDKLTKKSFAPIQITFCWEGQRLRTFSGEKCRPEHWDADAEEVIYKKGNFSGDINKQLADLKHVAATAHRDAQNGRRLLTEAELRAALTAFLHPPAADALPVAPAAPKTMMGVPGTLGWYDEWVAEQQAKIGKRTGKPTSKFTIRTYRATQMRLQAFETYRGRALRFEEMNLLDFYGPFQEYCLTHLGKKINTFGKYITHLSTFLRWCDEEMELPVHRKYRKFTAPVRYIGVHALTEQELRAIAALDFSDPALQQQLYDQYASRTYFSQHDHGTAGYFRTVELARDKLLLCCYTGLSIQDADLIGPADVHGELLIWERGKSSNVCHIPYYDDDLFQPVTLAAKYAGRSAQLVPYCPRVNDHLKAVARLVGLTRFKLSTKIGRKTFVTLKLYQGVPQRVIMQATGHTTEEAFNRYVGVDTLKILEQYKRHTPNLRVA